MRVVSLVKIVLSSYLIVNVFNQSAVAQTNVKNQSLKIGGGYNISGNKLRVLAGNYFTNYTIKLGQKETINKIERLIRRVNQAPRGSSSPKDLAQKIYSVSAAYGIDPILFTAKVWQESGSFNADVVAKGGDTGLTQMTGNGLNENRAQHNKINSRTASVKEVGNILATLAMNHLRSQKATNDWMTWVVTRNNREQKATLVRSVDYALMSGAALFKTYLAVKNGHYQKAISQYNGGGVKGYYGMVIKKENQVQLARMNISEEVQESLAAVCDIVDSEQDCNELALEVIMN